MTQPPPESLHARSTEEGPAGPRTVPELLDRWIRDYAELIAVHDPGGKITYAELDRLSANLSCSLIEAGFSKGARVGLLLPNGIHYLVAVFAVLRIGAVAVLMSTLARPRELAYMVRASDVDLLLSADRYLSNDYIDIVEQAFPAIAGANPSRRLMLDNAPNLRAVWIVGERVPGWASGLAEHLADAAPAIDAIRLAAQAEVSPSDPAMVIFTSGSSADPKAVIHSQASVVRQTDALAERMGGCGRGDRVLTTMPFFWVGGLFVTALAALDSGAAVLCPADSSMERTIAFLREGDATHICHWPQQLDLMKDNPEFLELLKRMRPAFAHQYELFGLAPAELTADSLGMTETCGPHSMYPMGPLPPDKVGSFGTAVGGIERIIIDPDTGEELPRGTYGQLCLRGGSLMIGMCRRSHEEVFDRQGRFRTDDYAMIDEDDHLFFQGRVGDIVKISGANVSPLEVEGVLRSLPGVKAALVAGLTENGGEDVLVAAIIAMDGVEISPEDLREQARELLSSYKRPRHYVLLRESELPMTASAKIYKPGLKALLRDRAGL